MYEVKGGILMDFKIQRTVLGLFFALGLVFSFSIQAFASHDGSMSITAGDVNHSNEEDVKEFPNHVVAYYNEQLRVDDTIQDPTERSLETLKKLTIFLREVRQEGDYNDGEIYMILMGNDLVRNHAKHSELIAYEFDRNSNSSVTATLKELIDDESPVGESVCISYNEGKFACARKLPARGGGVVTLIVGLHHELNDSPFKLPDCPGFELGTPAEEVYKDQTNDGKLEAYVNGVIRTVKQEMARVWTESGAAEIENLEQRRAQIFGEFHRKLACFREKDFKHENIYIFVMEANPQTSTVLVNGNDFDLNGANLDLNDYKSPGEPNIATRFNQALGGGIPPVGESAYVNYYWDDPVNNNDNVEGFLERKEVPGTSCKRSYIKVANIMEFSGDKTVVPYIFGSGTYQKDEVCQPESDDGGCALVSAGQDNLKTAGLNMFLLAAVLFLAVSRKSSLGKKFWTLKSQKQ